jgi:hypothetical protein
MVSQAGRKCNLAQAWNHGMSIADESGHNLKHLLTMGTLDML